jgi:hypothetical protein
MGKSAERNIGLLVLRIPCIRDFLFGDTESYKCLQEKWRPERMKAAIEAVTNKALTQYKELTFVSLPQAAGKMNFTAVRAMKAECSIVLNMGREAQIKQ